MNEDEIRICRFLISKCKSKTIDFNLLGERYSLVDANNANETVVAKCSSKILIIKLTKKCKKI